MRNSRRKAKETIVDANNNKDDDAAEKVKKARSSKKTDEEKGDELNKVAKRSRVIAKPKKAPVVENQVKTREQLIEDLLLQKEANNYFRSDQQDDIKLKAKSKSPVKRAVKKEAKEDDSDEFMSDDDEDDDENAWEEAVMNDVSNDAVATMSRDPIQIKIEGDKKKGGKKKQAFDFGAYMLRTYKSFHKKLTIELHKSHLICWLYHGLYLNKLTVNKYLKATCLSLLDSELASYMNETTDLEMATRLLGYLRDSFIKHENSNDSRHISKASLLLAIQKMSSGNNLEYILIVLAVLRSLNIRSRLCISFDVIKIKEDTKKSGRKVGKKKNGDDETESEAEDEVSDEDTKPAPAKTTSNNNKRKSLDTQSMSGGKKRKSEATAEIKIEENTPESSNSRLSRRCKATVKKYNEDEILDKEISGYLKDDDEEFRVEEMIEATQKTQSRKKTVAVKKEPKVKKEEQEEGEVKEEKASVLKLKTSKKSLVKNGKALSEDETEAVLDYTDELNKQKSDYHNYWIEIYLDKEEKWISVDPVKLKFDCDTHFEKRLNTTILYTCAFDNDNKIKDVTKRYALEWNTVTRKLRIEHFDTTFWWEKILIKYKPIDLEIDIRENRSLEQCLFTKPLPKTVGEYKSHPLFVLKRHLLKFQAIYPADVDPVGKFRDEPVYSTQNLVSLHSKQTWLKLARSIKPNEEPYKIVKGRVKWSEYKLGVRDNPDLELFGFWQTMAFEPPVAKNGKVPRNEYGNVELFQKSMLPIGCVHLKLPNLNKICRPLGIDCAPAVVGFDAHHGFSHAVIDGWIICEEFKDVILDAYREEEKQNEKKMAEKQKEKIWNNWRRLIKSLQVRERLKVKYGELKNSDVKSAVKTSLKDKIDAIRECEKDTQKLGTNNANEAKAAVSRKVVSNDESDEQAKPSVLKSKPKPRNTKSRARAQKTKKDNDDDESEIKVETTKDRNYRLRGKTSKASYKEADDESNSDVDEETKKTTSKSKSNKKTSKKVIPVQSRENEDDYFPAGAEEPEESIHSDDFEAEILNKKKKTTKKMKTKKTIFPLMRKQNNKDCVEKSFNLSEDESDTTESKNP